METKIKGVLKKVLNNIPLTVFVRTFLSGVGGFIILILLSLAYAWLGLPNGEDAILIVTPLTLGVCVGYIVYAKKLYGNGSSIGVSGILGTVVLVITLLFLIGALYTS